jgi:hypothetical protein
MASAIEHTSNRIEIILMKQMERRSALTLPLPRNWGEGLLLERLAAGGVGDRAAVEIPTTFSLRKNRIRAGFNMSAESGYSSNGIPAVDVGLRTSPERQGFGRSLFQRHENGFWLVRRRSSGQSVTAAILLK